MNRREIVEHDDGTFDIKIIDDGNNRLLVFSNQHYENREDAIDTATSVVMDPVKAEITFSIETS